MERKKLASITLGKIISGLTRTLKIGGGSAAPGLYALKLYPNLIKELVSQLPLNIIITGTNGKTTTSRMLAHFAQKQGLKVLRNSTGSNLERGVASTLISASHILSGKLKKYDLAIWELDEAAFNQLAPILNPKMVVFLNVFRDQLDRYGEVDTVVNKWVETLEKINKSATIYLNSDDYNLAQLKDSFKGRVVTFGLENHQITGEKSLKKSNLPKAEFQITDIKEKGFLGTSFKIKFNNLIAPFTLPLPGIYHLYDFLASFACAQELKIDPKSIKDSLNNFSPAFGRVEKTKDGYICLIKNPTGATQVFEMIKKELKKEDRLLVALNDKLADGTDISWIWDADFELLQKSKIFCSGSRAQDLALRLKYADFDGKSLQIEEDLKKALTGARKGLKGRLFVLPTYTALLELQKLLAKEGAKEHYWKEK